MLGVVGDRPGGQLDQPGDRRGRWTHAACSTASVATPSRRSVPGVLPDCVVLAADVDEVIGELERHADALAERGQGPLDLRSGAGHHRAEPARRGDQRAGLVRQHGEVVRDRVLAVLRTDRLADLAGAQSLERPRLDPHRLRTEVRQQVGGRANRKSPVRIATVLSQRAFAEAAPRRSRASSITSSWYSVARCVSSTTTAAAVTSAASGIAVLCGQQRQQRAEPLAAGIDQVAGGAGDERVLADHRSDEQILHRRHPDPDPGIEGGIGQTKSAGAVAGHGRHGPSLTCVRGCCVCWCCA